MGESNSLQESNAIAPREGIVLQDVAPSRSAAFLVIRRATLIVGLGVVRYLEISMNRSLSARAVVLVGVLFGVGVAVVTSAALSYSKNTVRGLGWWVLFEMYLLTSLILAPPALLHAFSVPLEIDWRPWTWIELLLLAKLLHLVLFAWWTWKRSGPLGAAASRRSLA